MSQHDAVLFANDAFYLAFRGRDMDAMSDIWAAGLPVTCIHPGWPPLFGREEVLESWAGIFSGDAPPEVVCHGATAHVYGETAAVICYEQLPDSYLIATNYFAREDGIWRIVHHQAGPTAGVPAPEAGEEPKTVN